MRILSHILIKLALPLVCIFVVTIPARAVNPVLLTPEIVFSYTNFLEELRGTNKFHKQMYHAGNQSVDSVARLLRQVRHTLDGYIGVDGKHGTFLGAVVLNSRAAIYTYNETVWSQYNEFLNELAESTVPLNNNPLFSNGTPYSIDSLQQNGGVRFIVDYNAIAGHANRIALLTGEAPSDVREFIRHNLIEGVTLAPSAGVAINDLHKRGFSYFVMP